MIVSPSRYLSQKTIELNYDYYIEPNSIMTVKDICLKVLLLHPSIEWGDWRWVMVLVLCLLIVTP